MPLSFLTMTLALAFMWFLCAPRTLVPDACLTAKHTLPAGFSLQGAASICSGARQIDAQHESLECLDQVPREVRLHTHAEQVHVLL